MKAISSSAYDLAPNGVPFRDIKSFAVLNFSSFQIKYCPRQCNKVADALAAHGSKMVVDPQAVWPGGAPNIVHDLVADSVFHVKKKKLVLPPFFL